MRAMSMKIKSNQMLMIRANYNPASVRLSVKVSRFKAKSICSLMSLMMSLGTLYVAYIASITKII